MPPEAPRPRIIDLIDGVRRRRILVAITSAVAVGSELTSIVAWVSWTSLDPVTTLALSMTVGIVAALFLLSRRRVGRTTAAAARAIERARPETRNLAVTAEELRRHPDRASPWMTARVMDDASRAVEGLTVRDVVAGKSAILSTAIALAVTVGIWFIPNARQVQRSISDATRSAVSGVAGSKLTIAVKPPEYSGLQALTIDNPERIDVLEGTRLEFSLADGQPARLRFGSTAIGTLSPPAGKAEVVARESGYFAIEEEGGSARLIALSVTPDHSPSVKIEQPARDLLLPEAKRSLPITITASDDLALTSLELRYTKVSGSGEQFEFSEGALPVRVTRESGRQWRADAQMALATLNLAAGDSLVYRAVARDGRPGDAGIGASDTFFIEIAGPGQVPFEGVEMPPEEERYALSQQMVVLKIERLRAREKTMTRDAVVGESALLAAEQRSVRANFVFLLGGHVEDEEVEAEQSSEIAEGRLQNTARRDITAAISHMTRAEQGLVAASTSSALPPARAAVEALQRAFGRSRYLLRSLASRTPLDPARRLTGDLATVEAWRRPTPPGEPRQGAPIRSLLAELIAASDTLSSGGATGPDLGRVAERALAIDPSASRWQQIARALESAHRAAARTSEVKKILDDVIQQVASDAGSGLVPSASVALPQSQLERAWRGGPRR